MKLLYKCSAYFLLLGAAGALSAMLPSDPNSSSPTYSGQAINPPPATGGYNQQYVPPNNGNNNGYNGYNNGYNGYNNGYNGYRYQRYNTFTSPAPPSPSQAFPDDARQNDLYERLKRN